MMKLAKSSTLLLISISLMSLIYGQLIIYGSASTSFTGFTDTQNDIVESNAVSFSPIVYSQQVDAPYIDLTAITFRNYTIGAQIAHEINISVNVNLQTLSLGNKVLRYKVFAGKEAGDPNDTIRYCEIEITYQYGEWSFFSYHGDSGLMSVSIYKQNITLISQSTTGFYYWDVVGGSLVVYGHWDVTRVFAFASEQLGSNRYNMDFYTNVPSYWVWNPTFDIEYETPLDNTIDVMRTNKANWSNIIIYDNYIQTKGFLDFQSIKLTYTGTLSSPLYRCYITLNQNLSAIASSNLNYAINYSIQFYENTLLTLSLVIYWNVTDQSWYGVYNGVTPIPLITINDNKFVLSTSTNWFLYYFENITHFKAIAYQHVPLNRLGEYYVDIYPNSIITESDEYDDVVIANSTSNSPYVFGYVSDPIIDVQHFVFEYNTGYMGIYDNITIFVGGGLLSLSASDNISYYFTLLEWGTDPKFDFKILNNNGILVSYFSNHGTETWQVLDFTTIINDYKIQIASYYPYWGIFSYQLYEYSYFVHGKAYRTLDNDTYYLDVFPNSIFTPIEVESPEVPTSNMKDYTTIVYYTIIVISVLFAIGLVWYYQVYTRSCNRKENMFSPYCMEQRKQFLKDQQVKTQQKEMKKEQLSVFDQFKLFWKRLSLLE